MQYWLTCKNSGKLLSYGLVVIVIENTAQERELTESVAAANLSRLGNYFLETTTS